MSILEWIKDIWKTNDSYNDGSSNDDQPSNLVRYVDEEKGSNLRLTLTEYPTIKMHRSSRGFCGVMPTNITKMFIYVQNSKKQTSRAEC